eukprot:6659822-Lingulodinium_polyedra.AAC.1
MVATEEMLEAHRRQLAQKGRWDWLLTLDEEEADTPAVNPQLTTELLGDSLVFMPDGVRGRIAGFLALARQRGLVSKKVALVNLSQTAGYSKQVSFRAAPALLRSTYLFDLTSFTEVLPVLNWLIMGFPVPGL